MDALVCVYCLTPLVPRARLRGAPRLYCNGSCAKSAWIRRRAIREGRNMGTGVRRRGPAAEAQAKAQGRVHKPMPVRPAKVQPTLKKRQRIKPTRARPNVPKVVGPRVSPAPQPSVNTLPVLCVDGKWRVPS